MDNNQVQICICSNFILKEWVTIGNSPNSCIWSYINIICKISGQWWSPFMMNWLETRPYWYLQTMGCTETIKYCLSFFFNLSFIGDKWEIINDKSIFFIFCPFLPNFCHFWWFFKVPKYLQHIQLWKMAKIWGKKWRKSLSRIFPVKNWKFQCNFDDFVG